MPCVVSVCAVCVCVLLLLVWRCGSVVIVVVVAVVVAVTGRLLWSSSVVTAKLLSLSSVVSLYTVRPELHDAARNVLSMPLLGVS